MHQESQRERSEEPLEGNFFTSHVLCYTDIDHVCAVTIAQRYLKEKKKKESNFCWLKFKSNNTKIVIKTSWRVVDTK